MSKKLLIVPDSHWPFESQRSWQLMCQAGNYFRPDVVIALGDLYDFNVVSSHPKTPAKKKDRALFEEELAQVGKARPDLERVGGKENIFLLGNHEDRLDRYVAEKAPELSGLLSTEGVIRKALGYGNGKWRIVPYRDHIKVGKVYFTHDVGHAGVGAVRQSQAAFEANTVIGHVHRVDYMVRGNAVGKPHVGAAFGWLGDPRQADYMYRVKVNREWSHGFGYGYVEDDGTTFLLPAVIIDGKCRVEGKLFR